MYILFIINRIICKFQQRKNWKILLMRPKKNESQYLLKSEFLILFIHDIYLLYKCLRNMLMLVILTQSDEFTAKKKWSSRPINSQWQRTEVVDGIRGVDYTFQDKSNSREEYIEFLNYLKPTILAVTSVDEKKTKDYSSPFWELKEFPDKVQAGYSTTEIINRVLEKCSK